MEFAVRQPFPLLDVMPPVLDDVVLNFVWDRERLWSLDLPETWVPMAELGWHLRLPMWAFRGRPFVLTPEQVAQSPRAFSEQYARTFAADISFPLHVLERPNRLTVLDGMHRLLQARLKGCAGVVVKKLPIGRLDEIACSGP
ncbi:hypothetical protein [Paractinoplanes hotanensis]|uniref:ParB/Sulfiredoxin domain-containing protein n=1 Tax=Paractinoplanes hotanensis TaxID=2906497 RepID=A0ABT0YGY4_9ACTN|nr:hypothetical protein [Actinoplanes hotanensis]MCM4084484.1 hypothetical protein [Actinoplanes hotanensis]